MRTENSRIAEFHPAELCIKLHTMRDKAAQSCVKLQTMQDKAAEIRRAPAAADHVTAARCCLHSDLLSSLTQQHDAVACHARRLSGVVHAFSCLHVQKTTMLKTASYTK